MSLHNCRVSSRVTASGAPCPRRPEAVHRVPSREAETARASVVQHSFLRPSATTLRPAWVTVIRSLARCVWSHVSSGVHRLGLRSAGDAWSARCVSGIWLAILYVIAGLIACLLIITIPFGV